MAEKVRKQSKKHEKKLKSAHKKEHHNIIQDLIPDEESAIEALDEKLEKDTEAERVANNLYADDPELHGHSKLEMRAREYALAFLGVVIGSLGTISIMNANGLTCGGLAGITRIIQHYTAWNYSVIYYGLAMIVALIVWVMLGVKEVRKILFMSFAYPVVMFVIELTGLVIIESDDLLLVSLMVGCFFGISNGITFKAGFSSGGSDSIAKIIKYRFMPHIGLNELNFAINVVVVVASAFVFNVNIAMYAIVITFVSTKVGEAVMYGIGGRIVELNIITHEPEALKTFAMDVLGRGATTQEITGGYTGQKREQIKVICSPRESFIIKRFLAKHDPKAFVTVETLTSVWGSGKGFSDIKKIDG